MCKFHPITYQYPCISFLKISVEYELVHRLCTKPGFGTKLSSEQWHEPVRETSRDEYNLCEKGRRKKQGRKERRERRKMVRWKKKKMEGEKGIRRRKEEKGDGGGRKRKGEEEDGRRRII